MNQAHRNHLHIIYFQVVYKIIEESGNAGIWAREIRAKSNLHLNTVDKVLRKLEGKKLIKSFNPVSVCKGNGI